MNKTYKSLVGEVSPLIMFDGECLLCSKSIRFVIEKEKGSQLNFTSLSSDFVKENAEQLGIDFESLPDSVLFYFQGKLWSESDAVLLIARWLKAPYNSITGFKLIPKFFRDAIYRLVARHRKKWFGTQEICDILHPKINNLEDRILL